MRTLICCFVVATAVAAFAGPAFAAEPAPRADALRRLRVPTTPGVQVLTAPIAIQGRITKPGVTFIIGRNFRAPTTLMSEDLWQEKLAKIAAGQL